MSEKLGPLAYQKREGPVFLGMASQNQREYSEAKAEEIDGEVYRLVTEGHQKAIDLLTRNLDKLHRLAAALLDKETIDGNEVEMIVSGGTLEDINRERENRRREHELEQLNQERQTEVIAAATSEVSGNKQNGSDPVGNPGPVTA